MLIQLFPDSYVPKNATYLIRKCHYALFLASAVFISTQETSRVCLLQFDRHVGPVEILSSH